MRREVAAYETLGLRPGASPVEVDEAYRRLIKRYHPDRTGGDGSRAAEINRAYTLLRQDRSGSPRPRRAVTVTEQPRVRASRRGAWMAVGAIAAVAAAVIASDIPGRGSRGAEVTFERTGGYETNAAVTTLRADFDEPLQTVVIDRAIGDAVRFNEDGDRAATLEFSRACHNRLRDEPNLTWFDTCVAFDEAMIILSGTNPLSESGPFNASSVMSRQMAAARMLSDDMFAADSRLHQIRSRVELALLPKIDEAAAQRL